MLGASCTWVGLFRDGMKWLSATSYNTSGTPWGWCQATAHSSLRLMPCALRPNSKRGREKSGVKATKRSCSLRLWNRGCSLM